MLEISMQGVRVGSTDGSHHLFIDRDGRELHEWPHPIGALVSSLQMKSCGLILEYDSQQFRGRKRTGKRSTDTATHLELAISMPRS
ncbi:MAG: hypothetical protein R3C05_25480 [Pirellulaceae bacterium]